MENMIEISKAVYDVLVADNNPRAHTEVRYYLRLDEGSEPSAPEEASVPASKEDVEENLKKRRRYIAYDHTYFTLGEGWEELVQQFPRYIQTAALVIAGYLDESASGVLLGRWLLRDLARDSQMPYAEKSCRRAVTEMIRVGVLVEAEKPQPRAETPRTQELFPVTNLAA